MAEPDKHTVNAVRQFRHTLSRESPGAQERKDTTSPHGTRKYPGRGAAARSTEATRNGKRDIEETRPTVRAERQEPGGSPVSAVSPPD